MRLIFAIVFLTSPAFAAPCGPHDAVIAALEDTFGETVQSRMMQTDQTMLEMLVNQETGTWTILVTNSAGLACSPASGDRFTHVAPGDPA